MSFINFIIIGTADDGPDGMPFLPDSIDEAENIFGWYQREYQTLLASQTSTSTTYPVWGGQVDNYRKIGSKLYIDALYQLSVDTLGTTISFGQPGVSGTYLFKYVRVPEEDNIVFAMKVAMQQNSDIPYLYRIPGEKSSVVIGDLLLQSEFSGEKYNNISVIVTGGYLTIHYILDFSTSTSVSYSISDPINILLDNINSDHFSNKHPLLASCPMTSPSIVNGVYTTSGGSNGQLTENTVIDAISSLDLDTTAIILLAGSPSSGVVSSALSYIEDQQEFSGSSCLIASAPYEFKEASSNTLEVFLNNLPFSSNRLFYVPGWGTSSSNPVNPTFIPLSHVFAGLWSAYTSSPTNKPGTLDSITPLWSTEQLHSLGEKFCVFNKFIISNLAPWRSSPTNGENPLINKVKTDIARRITDSLEFMIGEPSLSPKTVYDITSQALQGMDNIKELSFTCEVDMHYVIINIYVVVYGETQYIQLNLVSRRPENI